MQAKPDAGGKDTGKCDTYQDGNRHELPAAEDETNGFETHVWNILRLINIQSLCDKRN